MDKKQRNRKCADNITKEAGQRSIEKSPNNHRTNKEKAELLQPPCKMPKAENSIKATI